MFPQQHAVEESRSLGIILYTLMFLIRRSARHRWLGRVEVKVSLSQRLRRACSSRKTRGWTGKPYPNFRMVNIMRRMMTEIGGRLDLGAGNSVRIVAIVLALAIVASAAILSARAATTVSVTTDKPSYYASDTIMITGTITPAPQPNTTSAFVTVMNPNGKVVAPSPAQVGNNGKFHYTFGAGGTSNWISGTYTVNASWSGSVDTKPIWKTTTFAYSPLASTTTTSTTTTPSTTTTSTTKSTTSSTSRSSTSTTSSRTSTTSTAATSSIETTTTGSGGGGGIPG